LGGRLDATNVCDRPLVSIITSISKEHWQRLGLTVDLIAGEKAGILKLNCPAVIGKLPPEAETVVARRIAELNCPAVWIEPAKELNISQARWARYKHLEYPLRLLGEVQLSNSALAIAAIEILQQKGWKIPELAIQTGMRKTQWRGRLQWTTWQQRPLLIDGAHNPAAASSLRQYIDTLAKPVIWLMGMLSTKDHEDIFRALLHPQDELHLVPVPDHNSANPKQLAKLASQVCSQLNDVRCYSDLFTALKFLGERELNDDSVIVLCGSLYLIGYFFRQQS
jgi:dihydrofolate synthase / folylpolyglutamate synthase